NRGLAVARQWPPLKPWPVAVATAAAPVKKTAPASTAYRCSNTNRVGGRWHFPANKPPRWWHRAFHERHVMAAPAPHRRCPANTQNRSPAYPAKCQTPQQHPVLPRAVSAVAPAATAPCSLTDDRPAAPASAHCHHHGHAETAPPAPTPARYCGCHVPATGWREYRPPDIVPPPENAALHG